MVIGTTKVKKMGGNVLSVRMVALPLKSHLFLLGSLINRKERGQWFFAYF